MKWHEAILIVVVAAWLWRRLRKKDAPPRRLSLPEATLLGFRQAVQIAPNDAVAHRGLAEALCDLGRHEEALASFDRAAEIDPGPKTDIGHGLALLHLGRHEEALGPLGRAVEARPDSAHLRYSLGRALAGAKGDGEAERRERAMDAFREALRLDPGHQGAAQALGSASDRTVPAGQRAPGRQSLPKAAPVRAARPQGRQPLIGAISASPPMSEDKPPPMSEDKPPRKVLVLTPEKAGELLMELDTSEPYYYTKEKRRDPFEELIDEGVEVVYPES